MLETGSMGFLQINTKYCYLPEHKLTVLYLWQKITHISLTNSSVIPVLVVTFCASGKGRHHTPVQLPQLLPSKMQLLGIFKSDWAWGEPGPAPCPRHRRGWSEESTSCHSRSILQGQRGLRRVKELEPVPSIHMECAAHLSYMQGKAQMTPNDARSSGVC